MTYGTCEETTATFGTRRFGVFHFSNGSQVTLNEIQMTEFETWVRNRLNMEVISDRATRR